MHDVTKCKGDLSSLVGSNGAKASECLEAEYPNFIVELMPSEANMVVDYKLDRIRVYPDPEGLVKHITARGVLRQQQIRLAIINGLD